MRPPAPTSLSKTETSNLIVIAGLSSGILVTASIWLKLPNQVIYTISLFSLGLIGLGSFLFIRRSLSTRPRWVTILATLAAVSLVYLFPELFGPTCGGMPRAFASPLPRCGTCLEFVCEWNYKKHKEWCYCNQWDLSECTVSQPPTIEVELTCNQWGQNEWCAGSYLLDLTATEPQGRNVMISGSLDGTPFACPASSSTSTCSVPLPEGIGTATFTATSDTGLTTSGSIPYKHDSTSPQINGSLNGTTGSNGWFISPVEASASATDPLPGSGLATFSYNLNGIGWASYSGPLSLPDGIHSLSLRASDVAGNTTETVQTVRVDTATPILDLSLTGTAGTNGWYRSNILISATTSDAGSGLDTFEYDLDGAGWVPYMTPLELSDGAHSLSIRSVDVAGNNTTWAQNFLVDTTTPVLDMTVAGSLGSSGWYTSSVLISLSAYDPGSVPLGISGLDTVEYNLDGTGWTAYSTPLELGDGLHTLELRTTDLAGNVTSGIQSFPIDTTPPTLDVTATGTQGNSPWYISFVQVTALAGDATSDLTSLEVKVDGGEWSAYRAPLVFGDGIHSYRFRTRDNAGNITTSALATLQIDTIPPAISLPASWKLGKTVAFELHDGGSGLASVRLVIEDEDERYAKVTWEEALASYDYNGDINWNGRFKDGVLAPPGGEYYATLKVRDNAGNETHKPGQINVPFVNYFETLSDSSGNLVSGTGSDPIVTQIHNFFDEMDLANFPEEHTPSTLSFGGGNNNGLSNEQTGLNLGGENNGLAQPTGAQTGKLTFDAGGRSSFPTPNGSPDLMMGATAAAAIGAFAAEITRRKEEAIAAKRAANAEKNQRRKSNIAAHQTAINNFTATLEQARKMGMSETQASRLNDTVLKTGKIGAALGTAVNFVTRETAKTNARKETAGIARVITKEEVIEAEMSAYSNQPQELGESYNQYMAQKAYEIYRAGEVAAHTKITQPKDEDSWWAQTKAFLGEHFIEPTNTYFIQPYIKPAVIKVSEKVVDATSWVNENVIQPHIKPTFEDAIQEYANRFEWVNENIYQPHIKPAIDALGNAVNKGMTWLNEKVIEPYVQPFLEKAFTAVSKGITWANENIYQPYIKPTLANIDENFYQPYVKPFVDQISNEFNDFLSDLNKNLYTPIFKPVIDDINQNIYQPLLKPLQDKATDWWEETWNTYGEWVHNALDTVGFIPAIGDACDAINGLIYLVEGRYLEASLSAISIIPLGDLFKLGKWGAKLGVEVVEEVAKKAIKEVGEEAAEEVLEAIAEKTAKEVGENLVGKGVKELGGELVEKGMKEISKELAENGAKEFVEEASGKILKDTGEGLAEKATKQSVEDFAKKTISEGNEQILKQTSKETLEQGLETATQNISKNTSKEIAQQITQKVTKLANQEIKLVRKYGQNASKVIEVVGYQPAKKLLNTLDNDVIAYVMEQGPEAMDALSKWSGKELREHGPELALRAKQDAIALDATTKLVDLLKGMDPKQVERLIDIMKTRGNNGLVHTVETEARQLLMDSDNYKKAKELIETIASNSTHYADGKQLVLGKWVDYGNGFTKISRNTGSVHYNPHPEIWNLFEPIGKNREAATWLINKQVVETGIIKGLPIKYALEGVHPKDIKAERTVVEMIFSGASDSEIMSQLEVKRIAVRWQELRELKNSGYTFIFDEINNSYAFRSP